MSNKNVSISLRAIDKMSKTIDRVTKKFPKLNSEIKKTNHIFSQINRKTKRFTDSMGRVGKSMTNVGKSMTTNVTVPAALMGGAIIKTALGFEKSMNKVKALTGATGEQFTAMRDQAKRLGETTQFSASQAADAMAFLGMAGFDTNEIMAATPGLLDLAAASGVELGRAADIASNIMGAFNIEASKTNDVADVLAKTTASSNTNMEQLAEAMKFAGPVAAKFGMSMEDTATAVGLLGNVGIQGSLAGTSLRKALLGLAAPGSEAQKVMKGLGVSVSDSEGKMRKFPEILKDFAMNMKDLPKATQLKALNAVFGKTGISGAAALLEQLLPKVNKKTGELEVGFDKLGKKINGAKGAAKDMAATMQGGATGAVTRLKSATEGLFIAVADSGLLDAFASLAEKLTSVVAWMTKLSPTTMKIVTVMVAIAAVVGPVLAIFGSMVSSIAVLIPFLLKLAPALAFIGKAIMFIGGALSLPVAGFVALGAAIANVALRWDSFVAAFKSGKGFLNTTGNLFKTFFGFGGDADTAKTADTKSMNQQPTNVTQTNNASVDVNIKGPKESFTTKSEGVANMNVAFTGMQGI